DDGVLLGDVLLVLADVLPVLQHPVRLAVRHRLVDGNLGDLRDFDLAADVLKDVLRDLRICGRPGPGLLVERDRAAALRRPGGCHAGDGQRADDGQSQRGRDDPPAAPAAEVMRHSYLLPCLLLSFARRHVARSWRARARPCVVRSRAMPRARIASEATTPSPNSLRCNPCAT